MTDKLKAGEAAEIAAVRGTMNGTGEPSTFSVEGKCGLDGFIGRRTDGPPGVPCKPGYIHISAVHPDDRETVRAALTTLKGTPNA